MIALLPQRKGEGAELLAVMLPVLLFFAFLVLFGFTDSVNTEPSRPAPASSCGAR